MTTSPTSSSSLSQREYSIIKRDLIRLVLLNVFYLGGMLFLYFANQKSHFLDNWFTRFFRF